MAEKERELCVSSYKHTRFLDLGLILMSSFNLFHLLTGPVPKHSNIGGEASTCEFGRTQTFSPLCVFRELQTVQGGDTSEIWQLTDSLASSMWLEFMGHSTREERAVQRTLEIHRDLPLGIWRSTNHSGCEEVTQHWRQSLLEGVEWSAWHSHKAGKSACSHQSD